MTTASSPLSGKRALVTGGARGIGAAIALKLAQDGADVAITYESSAERAEALAAEIRALGRKAVAIQANAADADAVKAAVATTVSDLGGLTSWSTTRASPGWAPSPTNPWKRSTTS
jgi:3-oxoacyl-[acyl-carrier protein] reductase